MAWPDDAFLGGAEGAAAPAPPAEAEAGSVRLQFAGGQRLGTCVEWDRCSGLLAVELQPAAGRSAGGGIRVAILDPQAPQSYFVADVAKASASERLALLAWSPPGCRRLLLTVTSSGRAFSWGMEPPAAAAEAVPGAAPAGGGEGGGAHVPCVNRWYGRPAFELPLQRAGAFAEEPSLGFYGEDAANGAASSRKRHRLLCGRFLEPPGQAAAAWDVAGAPPFADRAMSVADVVQFYQQRGLERAFATQQPQSPQTPASLGAPQQLLLHWLRPGLLCFAAVTSGGQLLLACSGRGLGGVGEPAGGSWVLAPPVQLLGAGSELALADVAAAGGTASLLVAVAMAAAAGGTGQVQLLEVAGPPPPLLDLRGGADGEQTKQQQQQQRVARVVLPPSAVPPGAAASSLAFLPGQAGSSSGARLLLTLTGAGGTQAAVLTCSSSGGFAGGSVGLHAWQVQAGSGASLHPEQLPAAAPAACQDGASAAVLLPGAACLLSLNCQAGSENGSATCALSQGRPPVQLPLTFPVANSVGMAAAQPQGPQAGLAVSPHGLFAAVAAPGSSALLLVPLLALPSRAAGLEGHMLELGKRCCWSLLTATSAAAWWDLSACAAAVARQWGHQHLQVTQQLVDAAVAAARPESRQRLVIQWARLKSCLLSAAAAAHPAAAADCLAAAVQADAAAKEWLTTAADVFDQHLPDSAAMKAATSRGSAALSAEARAALVKLLPARHWAMWAGSFSQYFVRCLHAWVQAKEREQHGPAWPAAPMPTSLQRGAADQFVAEQNALADCVPCIRLLSDFQFYRSFGRLASGIHQLARLLNHLHSSSKPNNFTIMLQQVQLLQETVLLLKHLHEAYAKAKQAAEGGVGGGGEGNAASPEGHLGAWPRYGGAWTLVHSTPAPALRPAAVSAALQALRQQPGGSALLRSVPAAAEAPPGGQAARQGDTPRALLEAAVPLGLLPALRAAGTPPSPLQELLLQRDVALAGVAAGDGPGHVPLPTPAPVPDWPSVDSGQAGAAAAASAASSRPGTPAMQASDGAALQRQWEAERCTALGLPACNSGDPASYDETRDTITVRLLSWEYPVLYAAADGSCATAELQPEAFGPGSASAWQAAYATATPVGGQPWKRL